KQKNNPFLFFFLTYSTMKLRVFYISVAICLLTAQFTQARPIAGQDTVASPDGVHVAFDVVRRSGDDVAPPPFNDDPGFKKRQDQRTDGHHPVAGQVADPILQPVGHALGNLPIDTGDVLGLEAALGSITQLPEAAL
ncbi:unnamed protein product, partial [Absidia cylindrospora]